MTERELQRSQRWWYPLVRPRRQDEPRYQWITGLAWSWVHFSLWLLVLIVVSPWLLIEWLDNAYEDRLCEQWEREEMEQEWR